MKNKKLLLYLTVLMLVVFSFIGDWSRKEPETLAVGTSYLYDIKEDGKYKVIGEFLDVTGGVTGESSGGGAGQSKVRLITFEGETAAEAIEDPHSILEKNMYGAHNRVRFFTETLAKHGVKDIFDFYARAYVTDERPYLVVIKNEDPLLIYQADIGLSDRLGDYVYDMADVREKSTLTAAYTRTIDFVRDYYNEGKQCVMGVVEVVPNEVQSGNIGGQNQSKKYCMHFEGLAVFKEDKLVGYLDGEETAVYKFLNDRVREASIVFSVAGKPVSAIIRRSHRKIKTSFRDDKAYIDIEIKNILIIDQNNSDYDVGDIRESKIVADWANKDVEEKMLKAIHRVQTEYKSDIFGFGSYLHSQEPKVWKRIGRQWDDQYFPDAVITVKVNTRIDFDGQIRNKFGEKNVKQRKI